MDTNVSPEVDMDLLVDENPDPIDDYKEEVNKEVESQDPDPDKVVEADLAMDPAAATERFIRRNFGISVEELEEEADEMSEKAASEAESATESSETSEDELLGITPAAEETVVTVTPPEGGDTAVAGVPVADLTADVVTEEEVETASEPETAAEVSSLENLRMIFSREDDDAGGDQPDVSLNVETPNNDVDIDLEGKAVTIEPADDDEDDMDDTGSDNAGGDDVPAPETDEGEGDTGNEDAGNEDAGNEESDNSAESWWLI